MCYVFVRQWSRRDTHISRMIGLLGWCANSYFSISMSASFTCSAFNYRSLLIFS